jgi:hypothetical protein
VLRRLRYPLIALAGLVLVLLLLWAVVVVPPRLIDTSQIPDPAKRLDEVNGLRTNLLGVLAGLAVVAGAAVGALNLAHNRRVLEETQQQNRAVLELQRRGQVTERFTRAIEQLGQQGPEKLDVRIGAVYALEQIARDSAELHWPVMEVLTAYLREHARVGPDVGEFADTEKRLPADHQAIATVIGRRRRERDPDGTRLDFRGTDLVRVDWWEAHLEGAVLIGAHLESAHLDRAHLRGALLPRAHLEGAVLTGAHLEGAVLSGAHLEGALLIGAHLELAALDGAHLEGAVLTEADLRAALGLSVGQLRRALDTGSARLRDNLASLLAGPEPADEGRSGEGGLEAGSGS